MRIHSRDVPYGRVMAVMDQIKRSGADKVGMVTRPETPQAAAPAAKTGKPAATGRDRKR